jgi:ABC-type glutathione transport system ATPase component
VTEATAVSTAVAEAERDPNEILRIEGLVKYFPIKKGVFKHTIGQVRAVDGVDLAVRKGETVGVVGESRPHHHQARRADCGPDHLRGA